MCELGTLNDSCLHAPGGSPCLAKVENTCIGNSVLLRGV